MTEELSEALLDGLARLRENSHSQALRRFDDRTLCRVSLLPRWTEALATRLSLGNPNGYKEFIARLVQAGLVEVGITSSDAGEPQEAFWVRARRRREIGDHLRERLGASGLNEEYRSFCALVDRESSDDPEVRLWLRVRRFQEDSSGRALLETVEDLINRGDGASAATTIAAAKAVADVIGGSLDSAVTRAQWRLDRDYRARDDLDHLRGYFRRAEIESSLRELITEDSANWALHLRGEAGVGKTMVLRYLASGQFARDHGLPVFPVARIDFDHLDPRYPEQRPVELLVALTDQLVGFASSRHTEHYYRSVHDVAVSLHEEFATQAPDPARTARLIDEAIRRFVSLVEGIGAPVVLVLDTCEELAKLYAPGTTAPAIDRTFELLERLHALAPSTRVVFAGRRGLVPGPDQQASPALRQRPYLDVLAIAGFTEEEAVRFATIREVSVELLPAVLERSSVRGTGRFNPFDLESYSTWVRTDPAVDPEELLNAPGDPYIERRIIPRMEPAAVAALPVAVAFGTFDRTLIAPALRRLDLDPGMVFDMLAGQEWVRLRPGGHGDRPWVIEIDEHIRERMRRALGDDPSFDESDLGRDAVGVIQESRLGEVPSEVVEAAMRMLPIAEAAALWDEVDRRVLAEGEWGWATQVAARVAAGEAGRGRKGPNLLAAVLATRASAQIHAWQPVVKPEDPTVQLAGPGSPSSLEALWSSVLKHAARHPDPRQRRALTVRAICGSAAAGADPGTVDWADLIDLARESVFAGAVMAAAEAAAAAPRQPDALASLLAELSEHQMPQIAAQALILRCGLLLRRGTPASAAELAQRAVELTEKPNLGPDWADWVPPRGLRDRARLVRLVIALRGGEGVDEAEWLLWRRQAVARSSGFDVDADRLVAATIDYELCHRVPSSLPGLTVRTTERAVVGWLHCGLSRPAVVAAADALEAQGEVGQAVSLLRDYRNRAAHDGGDPRTLELCELALLRLCRRERTTEFAPVDRLAREGTPRVRDEAWLVLRLVEGAEPNLAKLGTGYGQWRCAPDLLPPPDDGKWQPADHLDVWELAAIRSEFEEFPDVPPADRAQATAALMAGEVSRPESASSIQLLHLAVALFETCGDERGTALAKRRIEQSLGLTSISTPLDSPETSPEGVTAFTVYKSGFRVRLRDARRFLTRLVSTPGWPPGQSVLVIELLGVLTVAAFRVAAPGSVPLLQVLLVLAIFLITWLGLQYLGDFMIDTIRIRRSPTASADLTNGRSFRLDQLDPRPPGRPIPGRRLSGLTVFGRYRLPDRHLPMPLGRMDVTLSRPLGNRLPHIVALDVDRELQGHPWEQWVGRGQPSGRARPLVVRLHRGERRDVETVTWAEWSAVFHGPAHLERRRNPQAVQGQRLLHIVGVPVRTSSGTFVRVPSARDTSAESRRAVNRESLLDLDVLTELPTTMLVLQAEPVDDRPRPLDEMREDFIRCALTAMDNDVDVVLIVPPLPDVLAAEVADLLWHELTDTAARPVAEQVFDVAIRVRSLIATSKQGASSASSADLDTILFYRANHLSKENDV
ncbi:ATP-binding protein [Amycolatopsis sp. NPDC051371]|uniref:ATP-binding protein n=1 Tax=Amycolatopsis sp. NPDC051371 TaxID=3155800 RepID=UPI00341F1DD1